MGMSHASRRMVIRHLLGIEAMPYPSTGMWVGLITGGATAAEFSDAGYSRSLCENWAYSAGSDTTPPGASQIDDLSWGPAGVVWSPYYWGLYYQATGGDMLLSGLIGIPNSVPVGGNIAISGSPSYNTAKVGFALGYKANHLLYPPGSQYEEFGSRGVWALASRRKVLRHLFGIEQLPLTSSLEAAIFNGDTELVATNYSRISLTGATQWDEVQFMTNPTLGLYFSRALQKLDKLWGPATTAWPGNAHIRLYADGEELYRMPSSGWEKYVRFRLEGTEGTLPTGDEGPGSIMEVWTQ